MANFVFKIESFSIRKRLALYNIHMSFKLIFIVIINILIITLPKAMATEMRGKEETIN